MAGVYDGRALRGVDRQLEVVRADAVAQLALGFLLRSPALRTNERREAAGKDTSRPNLIFGGDVHVVWEKFCRYFDVEPRQVPVPKGRTVVGPDGGPLPLRKRPVSWQAIA